MSYTDAPVLETDNLILRGPEERDIESIIDFLQDKNYSKGFGHIAERGDAWRWFALLVGHWHIRGYGYFSVQNRAGAFVGITGIWNPETWPEPELGWAVFSQFQGRNIAYEASYKVRDWAHEALGLERLASTILKGNMRSVKLAHRLGATFEGNYNSSYWGGEVMIFRHPSRETV